MSRNSMCKNNRGYFGIGIYHVKHETNMGTLWRSAYNLGASFIFCIGRRYHKQASDTTKTYRHIPFYEYTTVTELKSNLPYDCQLIGVEIDEKAKPLYSFTHPERACYLLGAEDHGLPEKIVQLCHRLIYMPSEECMNDNLPWQCPEHPDAKIIHSWDETTYLRCGGYPMGEPIKTRHTYQCVVCKRELAAYEPKEE